MRTTLTLDDDIAARLQAEARKTGRPFKTVVNDYLRAGLAQRRAANKAAPFSRSAREDGRATTRSLL